VLRQKKVQKIVDNFDHRKVRPVLVSKVRNVYHVIDGQHTIAAHVQLFGPDVQMLCTIFTGMTYAEEAALFASLDEQNTKLNAMDQFNADLEGQVAEAVAINDVVTSLGLQISNHNAGNVVGAIVELRKVHRKYNNVLRVLTVMKSAWGGLDSRAAYTGRLICGVATFLGRFPEADDTRLVSVLKREDPVLLSSVIHGTFKMERGDIGKIGAKHIRVKYNRKLKLTLPPLD